jgi:hypothetical protein
MGIIIKRHHFKLQYRLGANLASLRILVCLGLQYYLRSRLAQALYCPTKYWWLQGLGGVLVAVMAIASVIKAETGWGWTWRGRSLK